MCSPDLRLIHQTVVSALVFVLFGLDVKHTRCHGDAGAIVIREEPWALALADTLLTSSK